MTTSLTQYIDLYTQHAEAICAHAPAAMNALRADALDALGGATLPTKGKEDYEATDLEKVFATNYGVNINRVPFAPNAAAAPQPPSLVALPPRASTMRRAPRDTAWAISCPTP